MKQIQCDPFWEDTTTDNFVVEVLSTDSMFDGQLQCRSMMLKVNSDLTTVLISKAFEEQNRMNPDETKEVNHYLLLSWQDKTAPIGDTVEILYYLFELALEKRRQSEFYPPITVNCSAGLGRTGTFMAMYFIYKKLKDMAKKSAKLTPEMSISVFHIVRSLREQRWGLIHNEVVLSTWLPSFFLDF